MRTNLGTCPLADLSISFDRLRKPVKESDRRPGIFPYYGASGIVDHVDEFIFDGTYLLVAEDGENLRTRQTPIAFLASGQFWVNNHAHILQANAESDIRYLMYAISVSDVGAYLTGSTMPKLTAGNLARIPIPRRSLSEQRDIASILGALDDKIELNRKMSATLEAMARALYKSWFVDFDEVRAKVDGRESSLKTEIAALFPRSFAHAEIGEIPSGWNIRSLSSICEFVERGISPKYQAGSRNFIINQKVNRGLNLDLTALKELSFDICVPVNKLTREFDVLINCLGEGTLGRVHLYRGTTAYAVDQHMSICRPLIADFGPLIYEQLASPQGQALIEASKTGTTGMTMLNVSKLRDFPILWPGDEIAAAYGNIVAPLWQRIHANDTTSLTLAALRNTLLPKLISGELRVGDAERILEKSA